MYGGGSPYQNNFQMPQYYNSKGFNYSDSLRLTLDSQTLHVLAVIFLKIISTHEPLLYRIKVAKFLEQVTEKVFWKKYLVYTFPK